MQKNLLIRAVILNIFAQELCVERCIHVEERVTEVVYLVHEQRKK